MTDITEATMLYRKPAEDSDEAQISEVWGSRLETKVVDASEVESHAADGWVTNPAHIDNPPKSVAPVVDTKEIDALRERIVALEADLKAAQELADGESKAKDEALARVAEIEAKAKPTLSVKEK